MVLSLHNASYTVSYRDSSDATDTLTLHNVDAANTAQTPPTQVVTDPTQYPSDDDSFNPDYALMGQGNFVYISGARYWVPLRVLAPPPDLRLDLEPLRYDHLSPVHRDLVRRG